MPAASQRKAISKLLKATGRAHHEAFIATDGADPEWPIWYATRLESKLPDHLGATPTRSAIVHALVEAERRHARLDGAPPWPRFYARVLLAELGSSDGD